MTSLEDKTTRKTGPNRPISGGTYFGIHPERYEYWRVGYGTKECFPLKYWVERAGEFHSKANFATGDHHWSHSTQLLYHWTGEAVFEFDQCSRAVEPGDLYIVPPEKQFSYRGRGRVQFDWFALTGEWPAILGSDLKIRYLALGQDKPIKARFAEIRETLIMQKPGYPLKAIGIFYELAARIEELAGGSGGVQSTYPDAVRNAMTYLVENYAYPFKAAETAAAVSVSQSHLRALFEKWLGESPRQFHTRYRIDQASRLLREQRLSISEVALEVGYSDVRHFSRVFKRITGLPPSRFVRESG